MRGLRGYKWKILDTAMTYPEVTSHHFAEATGLPASQTCFYALELEREGYLVLDREVKLERGGRPMKVYRWTGKKPSQAALDRADNVWAKADRTLIDCFNRMVKCREKSNDALECAMQ